MTTIHDAGLVSFTGFAARKNLSTSTLHRRRLLDPTFPAPVTGLRQPLWTIEAVEAYDAAFFRVEGNRKRGDAQRDRRRKARKAA